MIEPGHVPEPPLQPTEIAQRRIIEPLLGALVIAGVGFILVASYAKFANLGATTYALDAWFPSIDGLQTGGDVRISGVKVGEVTSISIDPRTYRTLVRLNLSSKIAVPSDSVASVSTEGLLGSQYLELLPGVSDDMLKPGARIYDTKAPISLFKLLGQFVSGSSSTGGKDGQADGGRSAEPKGTPGEAMSRSGAGEP